MELSSKSYMLFYISICAFERGGLLSEQQHVQHMQIAASPGPTYTFKTKKIKKKTISNKHVKRTRQTHLNFIQDNGAGEEERKRRDEEEEDAEEEEEE